MLNITSLAKYIKDWNEDIYGREDIEWSNFWYDYANTNHSKTRILLVGDSTARMIRSSLAKVTNCPVDLFASSSSIDDILFINQIDAFFNQQTYKYDVIFVQIGHHGRINRKGGAYEERDYSKFQEDYTSLIEYLLTFSQVIITESIFDSINTHKGYYNITRIISKYAPRTLKCLWKKHEKPNNSINNITQRKNSIIQTISESLDNVFYLDINKYIKQTHFIHVDHIHFEDDAKSAIAQEMKKFYNNINKSI